MKDFKVVRKWIEFVLLSSPRTSHTERRRILSGNPSPVCIVRYKLRVAWYEPSKKIPEQMSSMDVSTFRNRSTNNIDNYEQQALMSSHHNGNHRHVSKLGFASVSTLTCIAHYVKNELCLICIITCDRPQLVKYLEYACGQFNSVTHPQYIWSLIFTTWWNSESSIQLFL